MIGSLNSSFSFNNYSLNIGNKLRINNNTNVDNADNTNIEKNNQSIESKKSSLDSKEVLGYKVDKEGYFTEDFNKAAGIPKDYKIHSSSLESLVKLRANSLYFTDIDIAKTIGNAYKILSQVVGKDTLKDKDTFSLEEIAKFPQGYEYDRRSLQVTKIHQTTKDYMNFTNNDANWKFLQKQDKEVSTLFFNSYEAMNKGLPATDIFNNNNGGKESIVHFNPNGDKYTNKDGSIAKGGLLVAIVNANSYTIEGTTTIEGKGQGFDKSLSKQEADEINSDFLISMLVLYATGEEGSWLLGTDLETFKKKHSELMKSYQRKLDQWRKEDEEFEKNYKTPLQIMLEELEKAMKENLKNSQKKKQLEKQKVKQIMRKLNINA